MVQITSRRLEGSIFGDLNRVKPLGNDWGNKRGGPVDRYYIEEFITKNVHEIKGNVLELEDGMYVKKYGKETVTRGMFWILTRIIL